MSNDNSSVSDNSSATSVKEKRTRTSPRVKFGEEILGMIKEEFVGGRFTLDNITSKIQTMMSDGPQQPEYAGRWYVGVKADNSRTAFQANNLPTKMSYGIGSKHDFTSVLGPMRTEAGADYRVKNPNTECEVVF